MRGDAWEAFEGVASSRGNGEYINNVYAVAEAAKALLPEGYTEDLAYQAAEQALAEAEWERR